MILILADDPIWPSLPATACHQRSIAVLQGQGSPAEHAAVCVNVAMALKLFGQTDLRQNFSQASKVLGSGAPLRRIQQISREFHE